MIRPRVGGVDSGAPTSVFGQASDVRQLSWIRVGAVTAARTSAAAGFVAGSVPAAGDGAGGTAVGAAVGTGFLAADGVPGPFAMPGSFGAICGASADPTAAATRC